MLAEAHSVPRLGWIPAIRSAPAYARQHAEPTLDSRVYLEAMPTVGPVLIGRQAFINNWPRSLRVACGEEPFLLTRIFGWRCVRKFRVGVATLSGCLPTARPFGSRIALAAFCDWRFHDRR